MQACGSLGVYPPPWERIHLNNNSTVKHKKKVANLEGRIANWEAMQRSMRPEDFKSYSGNKPGSVNK